MTSMSIGLASIAKVCGCFDLKRDAYYKYQRRETKRKLFEDQITHIVKKIDASLT